MEEEKLIEAVKRYRELYDKKHFNYMKTKLKNRIWDDIAKNLNMKDGEDAKTQWMKLRASYRDARRRQLKSLKSGAAPEDIRPWRFVNQMSFLQPFTHLLAGGRDRNDDSEDDSQPSFETSTNGVVLKSEVVEESNSHENDWHEQNHLLDVNYEDNGDESSSGTEFPAPSTASSIPVPNSKQSKNMKLIDVRNLLKREERERQRAAESITLPETSILDDPLYNFFISMYQLTKKMPSNYQHRIRGQLFQAVSQAEEEIMNIQSRTPLASSSSYFFSSPHSQHPQPDNQTP